MSTLKVGAIRGVSASSDAVTVANDGTCTANITNNLSNRNIIINGAMQVAQRSAAAVAVTEGTNENYQSIDRMHFSFGNAAAGACNISQSTDAPTTLGFTKSHKTDVTTVNSTSSGNGVISLQYQIEGQDLRSSGWNHLSDSSFLTLSFYFKTTKTGNSKLPILFRTRHGTNYYYVKNITVTDPTNWNRYTCKIPGNSNLTINDLATSGMSIFFSYQTGSDKDTGSEGSWGTTNAYSTSESTNYFDSTSNDMFITGIQLEVGEHATDFEHKSFSKELLLCQRYFFKLSTRTDDNSILGQGMYYGDTQIRLPVRSFTEMRTHPTVETSNSTSHFTAYAKGSGVDFATFDSSHQECPSGIVLGATIANNSNNGAAAYVVSKYDGSTGVGVVSLNAEL